MRNCGHELEFWLPRKEQNALGKLNKWTDGQNTVQYWDGFISADLLMAKCVQRLKVLKPVLQGLSSCQGPAFLSHQQSS